METPAVRLTGPWARGQSVGSRGQPGQGGLKVQDKENGCFWGELEDSAQRDDVICYIKDKATWPLGWPVGARGGSARGSGGCVERGQREPGQLQV